MGPLGWIESYPPAVQAASRSRQWRTTRCVALGSRWTLATSSASVRTRTRALALSLVFALALAGCSADKKSTETKGAAPATHTTATSVGGAPAILQWDGELGSFVATPSIERGSPLLFSRDAATTASLDVELFSHDARTMRATMQTGALARGCGRTAVLSNAPGEVSPVWSLALAPGTATPMAIDAIGELSPRDSAELIVRVNRLIRAIPDDSASPVFHGLPIVVRDAWKLTLPDSTPVVVAIAVRSLNTESNPRGQLFTVVIEPDPSGGPGAWRTAWSRSDAGPEDRLEGADLLAAISLRSGRPVLVLQRESDAGQQIDFVDRTAPGVWRLRWTTTTHACAQHSR